MLFSEAVAEVVSIVKRPDLASAARREVNSAISFYCLENEFPRDFTEQIVTLNAQEYVQSFALSLLTRFRRFKYLKRQATQEFLGRFSEAEMVKGCVLADKYYVVGTNVNVSMRKLAAGLDVGYFQYPPLLTGVDGSNNFWLLDVSPYMIVDRACAAIFRSIGDERSMRVHAEDAGQSYLAFRKDQMRDM